jgi:UPF0042 nucleotide-binding protein
MVFDMRYMKNPFYDESLRPLTGLDQPVKDFIMAVPEAASAQQRWLDWLHELIPQFIAQGRTRLSVAIGCTGGKHRSVFMAETLAESLARQFPSLRLVVRHREEPRWAARPLTAVSGTSSGQYKDTMHHG